MLKTRIITALGIGLVAFFVLFVITAEAFRIFMAVLMLLGSWEFARLADLGKISRWVLLVVQSILLVLALVYWNSLTTLALPLLAAACLSWCLMLLRLVSYRPGEKPGLNYRMLSFFCALASISFAWFALCWLRDQAGGVWLVLLLLFIIWAADIGAYFAGRRLGRHKLAPSISPGKTREGLAGGLLLALLVAQVLAYYTGSFTAPSWSLVLITATTALVSAGGDLFISIHKRTAGLKDSGQIFPGHGGVLDRFDSLLAGAPFFALGVLLMGI
ncbi:MAG TPA: phosphatidate cytidylyltransferase [Xanthomonadales bacterium]|nr:phosphatidate cytidylyltransferase [Xanthomonadales bacterium]